MIFVDTGAWFATVVSQGPEPPECHRVKQLGAVEVVP